MFTIVNSYVHVAPSSTPSGSRPAATRRRQRAAPSSTVTSVTSGGDGIYTFLISPSRACVVELHSLRNGSLTHLRTVSTVCDQFSFSIWHCVSYVIQGHILSVLFARSHWGAPFAWGMAADPALCWPPVGVEAVFQCFSIHRQGGVWLHQSHQALVVSSSAPTRLQPAAQGQPILRPAPADVDAAKVVEAQARVPSARVQRPRADLLRRLPPRAAGSGSGWLLLACIRVPWMLSMQAQGNQLERGCPEAAGRWTQAAVSSTADLSVTSHFSFTNPSLFASIFLFAFHSHAMKRVAVVSMILVCTCYSSLPDRQVCLWRQRPAAASSADAGQ